MELTDSERGVIISSRDDEGAFLVCQPEETEERGAGHEGGSGEEGDGELGGGGNDSGHTRSATEENTAFAAENAVLSDENTTLRKEVSELKVKVAEERDKYKSLWREL